MGRWWRKFFKWMDKNIVWVQRKWIACHYWNIGTSRVPAGESLGGEAGSAAVRLAAAGGRHDGARRSGAQATIIWATARGTASNFQRHMHWNSYRPV